MPQASRVASTALWAGVAAAVIEMVFVLPIQAWLGASLRAAAMTGRRRLATLTVLAVVFAVSGGAWARVDAAPSKPRPVQPGSGVVALTGPWRFSLGDNPGWTRPDFDDRRWESVDLTPRPHAHDADVGLSGYVPGWSARGHADYSGYAWYRLALELPGPQRRLGLVAPTLVDSAYELYWDGRRLGGIGDFSRSPPTAFGIRPATFDLDEVPAGPHLLAVRTWMDPAEAGAPEAGGLHVAPSIGEAAAIVALHRRQALTTFEGYVVDAVEPLAFFILAAWAMATRAPGRAGARSVWLAAALVLTALLRLNQPIFFWTSWESIRAYDALRNVIETPAVLAVWMIALGAWLSPPRLRLIKLMAILLGASLATVQLLSRSWFFPGSLSALRPMLHEVSGDLRLGFVALFAGVLASSFATRRRRIAFIAAFGSSLLIGIALFADELSRLGLKGVWFPFGIGVSRTQFAYGAAIVALAFMIEPDVHERSTTPRLPVVVQ